MKTRHSRFQLLALFTSIVIGSVLGIVAITIAWKFDYSGLHSRAKWLQHARGYKHDVLSQPTGQNGSLQHIEWDGWGFAGAGDTTLYLAFDPQDRLLDASSTGRPGKYPGIPCEVFRVRRLEEHWYTVQFYTDQDWNNCK